MIILIILGVIGVGFCIFMAVAASKNKQTPTIKQNSNSSISVQDISKQEELFNQYLRSSDARLQNLKLITAKLEERNAIDSTLSKIIKQDEIVKKYFDQIGAKIYPGGIRELQDEITFNDKNLETLNQSANHDEVLKLLKDRSSIEHAIETLKGKEDALKNKSEKDRQSYHKYVESRRKVVNDQELADLYADNIDVFFTTRTKHLLNCTDENRQQQCLEVYEKVKKETIACSSEQFIADFDDNANLWRDVLCKRREIFKLVRVKHNIVVCLATSPVFALKQVKWCLDSIVNASNCSVDQMRTTVLKYMKAVEDLYTKIDEQQYKANFFAYDSVDKILYFDIVEETVSKTTTTKGKSPSALGTAFNEAFMGSAYATAKAISNAQGTTTQTNTTKRTAHVYFEYGFIVPELTVENEFVGTLQEMFPEKRK